MQHLGGAAGGGGCILGGQYSRDMAALKQGARNMLTNERAVRSQVTSVVWSSWPAAGPNYSDDVHCQNYRDADRGD